MATVATPIKIGLADRGRAMSLEEFMEAEETDGYRYELARGVLEFSATSRSSPASCCPASRRPLPSCGLTPRTKTPPIRTRTVFYDRHANNFSVESSFAPRKSLLIAERKTTLN